MYDRYLVNQAPEIPAPLVVSDSTSTHEYKLVILEKEQAKSLL